MNQVNSILSKVGSVDLSSLPDNIESEFKPKTFSKILIRGVLHNDSIEHITDQAYKKLPKVLETPENYLEIRRLVMVSIQNLLPHVDQKKVEGFLAANPEAAGIKNLSERGIGFIKDYERFSSVLYDKDGAQKGNTTIGYGHLVHMGPIDGRKSEEEFRNGITRKQGDELFVKDVQKYIDAVNRYVKVPLTQNQFDALVSFTYNIGTRNDNKRTGLYYSKVLELINSCSKDNDAIAKAFAAINTSGGIRVNGLVLRRKDEADIFLNGEYDRTPASRLKK